MVIITKVLGETNMLRKMLSLSNLKDREGSLFLLFTFLLLKKTSITFAVEVGREETWTSTQSRKSPPTPVVAL